MQWGRGCIIQYGIKQGLWVCERVWWRGGVVNFWYNLLMWPSWVAPMACWCGLLVWLLLWPSGMGFQFGLLLWPSGVTFWSSLLLWPSGVALFYAPLPRTQWSTTRMHSSRMCTGHALTIPQGVCLPEGGALPARGGLPARGVCLPGGSAYQGGSACQGGASQHALGQTPPLTESQTGVKILPWPNFVAAGNKLVVCILLECFLVE